MKLKNQIENENIQFYLNEKPINKNHVFTNEPLGVQIIKAIITYDNGTRSTKTSLTLLAKTPPKLFTYSILNTFPHKTTSYTQGLEFDGDLLFESTGLNGQSTLKTLDFKTGKVINDKPLDESYFGEGLTILNDK
ncbi:glutaminyl-peptide cyclotransferase, partial [Flavobacteriaceae bacterium]|nr:glutaminyl-peptide cyclotransferase [Flavobacteriaceae bacterium]